MPLHWQHQCSFRGRAPACGAQKVAPSLRRGCGPPPRHPAAIDGCRRRRHRRRAGGDVAASTAALAFFVAVLVDAGGPIPSASRSSAGLRQCREATSGRSRVVVALRVRGPRDRRARVVHLRLMRCRRPPKGRRHGRVGFKPRGPCRAASPRNPCRGLRPLMWILLTPPFPPTNSRLCPRRGPAALAILLLGHLCGTRAVVKTSVRPSSPLALRRSAPRPFKYVCRRRKPTRLRSWLASFMPASQVWCMLRPRHVCRGDRRKSCSRHGCARYFVQANGVVAPQRRRLVRSASSTGRKTARRRVSAAARAARRGPTARASASCEYHSYLVAVRAACIAAGLKKCRAPPKRAAKPSARSR